MRLTPSICAAILAVATLPFNVHANDTKDLRDDPVVQAVEKTIASVVAIRVPRPAGERDMIGSGVIVDKSGYIVTNRHVTGGKKYVNVKLDCGIETKGEVIVADAELDLAVIRIQTDAKLHELHLGCDKLRLAEKVIAIGSPFGYEGTVSLGIVSAKNRQIKMPNDVMMNGLIQHTAAINPGNSGGPLINVLGQVIGINVAMRDGAQNIAFAINATTVKNFLEANLNAKRVAGIEHGLTCEERLAAKSIDPLRVVVRDAHKELMAGDQIVTVGSLQVRNTFDVERALWHSKPGQKVGVRVIRQGQEMAATLTLTASQGAGSVAATSAVTTSVRSAIER